MGGCSWLPDVFADLFYRKGTADIDNIADSVYIIKERSRRDIAERGQTEYSVCVCVCSLSYVLAVGSSVVFQPHTINMSLWRGRGAPGMLTCGGAALTTIDKRVRWLLVIKIPGGESYIGGHLTSRLEAVVADASFLSGSSLLLKRVICLLQTLTKQPITLLFTGWLISAGAKNALNHQLPASETNMEWHGRQQRFPDQV